LNIAQVTIGIDGIRWEKMQKDTKRYRKIGKDTKRWERMGKDDGCIGERQFSHDVANACAP